MRPIDADAIKAKMNAEWFDGYPMEIFRKYVDDAPTIEPKRGKWIWKRDKNYSGGGKTICTACGCPFSDGAYFEVEDFDFCPNCGAKMERSEE